MIDNKLVTTRRTIANEFNKYFVSLASKLKGAGGGGGGGLHRNSLEIDFIVVSDRGE